MMVEFIVANLKTILPASGGKFDMSGVWAVHSRPVWAEHW